MPPRAAPSRGRGAKERDATGVLRKRPAAAHYFSSRDSRRSASGRPPVWQVGQYCSEESLKDTSRTVSPHTGHGSPVRPCTRSPLFFSAFSRPGRQPRASAPPPR